MADKQEPRPKFSESDRAELDEFLHERKFKEQLDAYHAKLADRRKRRVESVRGWASLVVTIAAAVTLVADKLVALWKWLLSLAG